MIKNFHITIFLNYFILILCSCSNSRESKDIKEKIITKQEIIVPEFQIILDSAKINGSILIYDFNKGKYFSNDFNLARKGHLPASTFKIPNSLIALETGVVKDDSTLFKWDGKKRRIKKWEQDLIFKDAFQFSCLPCYQEVARKIGTKNMKRFIASFKYGNMIINSSNIDLFWIKGGSTINQFQQIDFLNRFYHSELTISKRTDKIMRNMMIIEEKDGYKISGKTGWSNTNGNHNGWFVGYIELDENLYFFATNVDPKKEFEMKNFFMVRKDVTLKAFEKLKS